MTNSLNPIANGGPATWVVEKLAYDSSGVTTKKVSTGGSVVGRVIANTTTAFTGGTATTLDVGYETVGATDDTIVAAEDIRAAGRVDATIADDTIAADTAIVFSLNTDDTAGEVTVWVELLQPVGA